MIRQLILWLCPVAPARHRRGTAAIEFALILPIIALLFTALFDLGYLAYETMEVQAAAEAGAQYAAKNTWNAGAITAAVTSATGMSGISAVPAPTQFCACPTGTTLSPATCGSTCSGGGTTGTYGQISAQKQHWTVLPYPTLPQPFIIAGQAIRRLK